MSHDRWRDQLREARVNTSNLAAFLEHGMPDDGLQIAGSAILATTPSVNLAEVRASVAAALRERGWVGDSELAEALNDHAQQHASALVPIAVDLDDLAETVDQSAGSESYIDVVSGAVWPSELFDIGQGPEDFDPDDAGRWLLIVGGGSTAAFGDMERFIASVEPEVLRVRLRQAISGKAPFKAFLAALERDADQFTSWHRHRDDARIGRARYWLAEHGYTPVRP